MNENLSAAIVEMRTLRDKLEALGYACLLIAASPMSEEADGLLVSSVSEADAVSMCQSVIGNIQDRTLGEPTDLANGRVLN